MSSHCLSHLILVIEVPNEETNKQNKRPVLSFCLNWWANSKRKSVCRSSNWRIPFFDVSRYIPIRILSLYPSVMLIELFRNQQIYKMVQWKFIVISSPFLLVLYENCIHFIFFESIWFPSLNFITQNANLNCDDLSRQDNFYKGFHILYSGTWTWAILVRIFLNIWCFQVFIAIWKLLCNIHMKIYYSHSHKK